MKLCRVPILRQLWKQDPVDGSFSSSLHTGHSHRVATTHSLVFDLGLLVILSSLTKRFSLPLTTVDPEHVAVYRSSFAWLLGDNPYAETLWQLNDVVSVFLPIFHRWLTTNAMLNRYDAEDAVFFLFWVVELSLLIYAGMLVGCGIDPKCRAGCSELMFAFAAWSAMQLAMHVYCVVANTATCCIERATKVDVEVEVIEPAHRALHAVLHITYYILFFLPSIVLWVITASAWAQVKLTNDECAAQQYNFVPGVVAGWLFLAPVVFEWLMTPLLKYLFLSPTARFSIARLIVACAERHQAVRHSGVGSHSGIDESLLLESDSNVDARAIEAMNDAVSSPLDVRHALAPQDVVLTGERYSLFAVLVLGEFVVASTKIIVLHEESSTPPPHGSANLTTTTTRILFSPLASDHPAAGAADEKCIETANYFGAFLAVLCIVSIKLLYFELSDAPEVHPTGADKASLMLGKLAPLGRHALQRSFGHALGWTWLHSPLFIAMLCVASVFERYIEGKCIDDAALVLLSLAVAVLLVLFTVLASLHAVGDPRAASSPTRPCIPRPFRLAIRLALAAIAAACSAFAFWEEGSDTLFANLARSHVAAAANTAVLVAAAALEAIGRYPLAVSDEARAQYGAECRAREEESRVVAASTVRAEH